MTEPTPDRLQEWMGRFGYTEQEARVAVHLEEAEKLLDELRESDPEFRSDPASKLGSIIWNETHTHEHFNALRRRLTMLVLRRDYPEGWGYVPSENGEEEDQG